MYYTYIVVSKTDTVHRIPELNPGSLVLMVSKLVRVRKKAVRTGYGALHRFKIRQTQANLQSRAQKVENACFQPLLLACELLRRSRVCRVPGPSVFSFSKYVPRHVQKPIKLRTQMEGRHKYRLYTS